MDTPMLDIEGLNFVDKDQVFLLQGREGGTIPLEDAFAILQFMEQLSIDLEKWAGELRVRINAHPHMTEVVKAKVVDPREKREKDGT